MEIVSCISDGIQGIRHVCESFEKIQLFRDKPHPPVYYINGKVFGNDCNGHCRRCYAWLQIYFVKYEDDLGIRYVDL